MTAIVDKSNRIKRPWSPLAIIAVVIVFGVIYTMAYPVVKMAMDRRDLVEKTTFAKATFSDLVDFDAEFGGFPSDRSAIVHQENTRRKRLDLSECKGDYSDDYLRQLIELRKANNKSVEDIDYSAFSYIKNQSSSDSSGRPLLVARMLGDGVKFDAEPYGGKAVVLRIDGSVKQLLIHRHTKLARIGGGKTLFETGPDTVWGDDGFHPSMLVHPDPNPSKSSKSFEPSVLAKIIIGLLVLGVICLLIRKRKQDRA